MPDLVTIKAVKHPRYKYRASYNRGGEYHQNYFTSKQKALDFRSTKTVELLNEGVNQTEFTDEERRGIYRAREIAAKLATIGESFTIKMALDHFEKHMALVRTSVTIGHAYDQFIEAKEREVKRGEIGERHLSDLRSRLTPFVKKFSKTLVANITTAEVEGWLNRLNVSAQTRINYLGRLQNLIQFCLARGYAKTDPLAPIKRPRTADKPVEIFTADEAKRLLAAACNEIRPALAIGFFAGLRAAEISKLDWSEVNLQTKFIEVKAAKAKSKRRRLVEISDNLAAWLKPLACESGPVAPTAMKMRVRLKTAMAVANVSRWPHNGLRHSFASFHYALHQSADRTAAQLGHGDTSLLFEHYRELVSQAEGENYFFIRP